MSASLTENLGFARLDHGREKRKGFPEVIFGPGKSTEQILILAEKILARSGRLLITRVSVETFNALHERFPFLQYDASARAIFHAGSPAQRNAHALKTGHVLVLCAGTSDISVADEAALTARLLGCKVKTFHDVGVAGLHRLLDKLPDIKRASVVLAVAGMDAALPTVVAGLIDKPVIAVPTSVGYGSSFGGVAALLALLNSCASGVTVVNIDNGFGAGFAAAQILKLINDKPLANGKPLLNNRPVTKGREASAKR